MKKKIISVLGLCAVIVFAYFFAYIDYNTYLYNRNADARSFYGTSVLKHEELLKQVFVAEKDTIDGLNIKVNLSGDVTDVELRCSILDAEQQEVSFVQIKASELEANKFNNIELPTIADTQGKEFTIVLQACNSDELNGVGFYVDPALREEQVLQFNDSEMEGNLVARVISHRFDVETFVMLVGIIVFVTVFMKILYKFFK